MCSAGKIKCLTSSAGFTVNQEYPVVSIVAGGDVVTINDSGQVKTVAVTGSTFGWVELYTLVKVV